MRDEAARGFQRGAAEYEQSRPSYPGAVLELLVGELGVGPGARVCDLAAGTGKLTRLLVGAGADVVAVEPVEGMRDQLGRVLPDVEVLDGLAESVPLPDASVDAVTVAQAFHWFDVPAALGEIARVLRPGGGLAMIWNVRDESVDWVARFTEIIVEQSDGVPYRRDRSFEDWAEQVAAVGSFSPLHEDRFDNPQPTDLEGVVVRAASTSFVSALADDRREALLDDLRAMLLAHPDVPDDGPFTFPYQTDVYWCRRRT